MSTQEPPKKVIRGAGLRDSAGLLLFFAVCVLIECLIVLYAINLGVKDDALLQWSFKFPGTDWTMALAISPLFHLIPIAVIVTLISIWTYLSKRVTVRPVVTIRGKSGSTGKQGKDLGLGFLRTRSARITIRSASIILIVFSAFILLASVLTYPRLIYYGLRSLYQSNPLFLDFVKGTGETLASVGSVFSAMSGALLAAAPGFRDFGVGVGGVTQPLVSLNDSGKYLVFQNVAAWVSAVVALLYGEYGQRGYRYKKR